MNTSRPDRGPQTDINPPPVTNDIAICHKHVQDTSRSTDAFSIFGLQLVDPWTARPCVCVCVCVLLCLYVCVCVGGDAPFKVGVSRALLRVS